MFFSLTIDSYLPPSLEDVFFRSSSDVFIARYLTSLNLFSVRLAFFRIHRYVSLSVQPSNCFHFHDEQPIFSFDSQYLCCISEEGQLTFVHYSFLLFIIIENWHWFLLFVSHKHLLGEWCKPPSFKPFELLHSPYDIHFLNDHNFKII